MEDFEVRFLKFEVSQLHIIFVFINAALGNHLRRALIRIILESRRICNGGLRKVRDWVDA